MEKFGCGSQEGRAWRQQKNRVGRWNRENAELALERGDLVMAVNGSTGTGAELREMLQAPGKGQRVVELTVRREEWTVKLQRGGEKVGQPFTQ